jgi:hypothetical protein
MTRCLTDTELQAVADNESAGPLRAHVAGCPRCRARVEDVQRDLARVAAQTDHLPAPSPDFERRVRHALLATQTEPGQLAQPETRGAGRLERGGGATTVRREQWRSPVWQRRAWTSGLAAAALVVLAVFVIWPSFTKESRLSAAEILGRSLQTFSTTSGIETLEYDVQLEGIATRAMLPDGHVDSMRVEQVIDHDHPGRYRVRKVDSTNTLRLVLAQDPTRGERVGRFRIDDRMYFFKFAASSDHAQTFVSLPDLQRAYVRALVTMMQGMADQKLATIDDGSGAGPYYAIQMPKTAASAAVAGAAADVGQPGAPMWDLSEAHALIHAGDFHLKELSARGTFIGQPFGIAFTLVRHDSTPSSQINASEFTVEPEPGDIMLQGEATADPAADIVLAALRALAQSTP